MYRCADYAPTRADIRDDGNFVGGIVLLITALLSLGFTVLSLVLVLTGRLSQADLAQEDLGLGNTGYMHLYMYAYVAFMGIPPLLVCLLFRRRLPCIQKTATPMAPITRVIAFLVGMGGCAVANIVASFVARFLERFGIMPPESPNFMDKTPQSLVLNLFVSALLPALLEEIAFRKCIIGVLQKYGQGIAVFVSALLFGVVHGGIAQSVFAFIVGLVVGYITVKTGNIRIAVAVHFANNGLAVLAEYIALGIESEVSGALYTMIVLACAVGGFIAWIYARRTKNELFAEGPKEAPLRGALGTLWGSPLMVIATILLILRMFYANLV